MWHCTWVFFALLCIGDTAGTPLPALPDFLSSSTLLHLACSVQVCKCGVVSSLAIGVHLLLPSCKCVLMFSYVACGRIMIYSYQCLHHAGGLMCCTTCSCPHALLTCIQTPVVSPLVPFHAPRAHADPTPIDTHVSSHVFRLPSLLPGRYNFDITGACAKF